MVVHVASYHLARTMRARGVLQKGKALLELGQSQWGGRGAGLGTVDALVEDISHLSIARDRKLFLINKLKNASDHMDLFAIGDVHREVFYSPEKYTVIDFHGTSSALKMDLNDKINLNEKYEICINNGTAEHVFNIGNVFETIHRHTKPGGLMVHEAPFIGSIDHGFYCLHPTLIYDLCAANGYKIYGIFFCAYGKEKILEVPSRMNLSAAGIVETLGHDVILIAYLGKADIDSPFVIPMQGRWES